MNVQSDLRICARAECATRNLREACFKLTETYSEDNGGAGISPQKRGAGSFTNRHAFANDRAKTMLFWYSISVPSQ
jgi:hypothetical protein